MLLFSADGKGIVYDDTAIDNLLDRNQVGEESTEGGGGGGVENLLANEYLGSFKVGLVCLFVFFQGFKLGRCSWYGIMCARITWYEIMCAHIRKCSFVCKWICWGKWCCP